MQLHYLKIGAVVIGVAVLTYIFFPGNATQNNATAQSRLVRTASAHRNKSVHTGHAKLDRHKSMRKKSRTKRVTEARIEPDKTLRKEGLHRKHSGPPSKMYGGL